MTKYSFTPLMAAILATILSSTAVAEVNYSGYLKSYALFQDEVTIAGSDKDIESNAQSQNAMRLMASYFFEDTSNIEIHYEIQPLYFSDYNPFAESNPIEGDLGSTIAVGANPYRLIDIDPILNSYGDHTVVLQNLDRLNYRYSTNAGDLTIGRQVISFGSARFINPTDIFIPFAIQTLNQEYRIGIDAIRFQAELGDFAVLDSGIIIGEDAKKENSAFFLRAKNSLAGNDIEGVLIALNGANLIGTGIERAIYDFGFWFEAAYLWYGDSKLSATNDNYWRSSIGSDYALSEDTIFMLEYHYNGSGESSAEDYLKDVGKQAYQKYGVFLYGKQYLIPAISWVASPLLIFTASGFLNLNDNSIFLNALTEISWSDNFYSDIGIYLSTGDGISVNSSTASFDIGSEFGSYPISLYGSLRYYF